MSSVVNFTSSSDNNDGSYEQLDFLNKISCPTVDGAANLSLSLETFLEAAVALKEQVYC
ncbi:hypothetical protein Hanom_Chr00s110414g01807481 [Helianthus anomalus]